MIGKFLAGLTPEQEDRVLTRPMQPGPYCGGCLIGTVYPISSLEWFGRGEEARITYQDLYDPPIQEHGRYHVLFDRVGMHYDRMCERFGTTRLNAAIRARVLRNRLRRGAPAREEALCLATT